MNVREVKICQICYSTKLLENIQSFTSESEVNHQINEICGIKYENDFSMCESCFQEFTIALEFRRKVIKFSKLKGNYFYETDDLSNKNLSQSLSIKLESSNQVSELNKINQKKFNCDKCNQTFNNRLQLKKHQVSEKHLPERKIVKKQDQEIPCHICGKILKNRTLLNSHIKSHQVMTADDYWYCDLCPRKFKTKCGCTWHIQQRHVLKVEYPCTECEMIFKGKWQLKLHVKSKHSTIRDYICEICGKGFVTKDKHQAHKRIHTGERIFKCKECPQTFIHRTDLRRHVWGRHEDFRPYKCSCGKGYMKNSELKIHQKRNDHS